MKTKINVSIHKECSALLMALCDFVGQHNSGKITIDPAFMKSVCILRKIETPSLYNDVDVIYSNNGILVTDNQNPIITLTWVEIHELDETDTSGNGAWMDKTKITLNPANDLRHVTYPEGLNNTEADLLLQGKLS